MNYLMMNENFGGDVFVKFLFWSVEEKIDGVEGGEWGKVGFSNGFVRKWRVLGMVMMV